MSAISAAFAGRREAPHPTLMSDAPSGVPGLAPAHDSARVTPSAFVAKRIAFTGFLPSRPAFCVKGRPGKRPLGEEAEIGL